MDALSQEGQKKTLDLDDSCILGIYYMTAWRRQGLDGIHLICILVVCKDRPDAYYGEALESNNLVILVSLVGQKRRK